MLTLWRHEKSKDAHCQPSNPRSTVPFAAPSVALAFEDVLDVRLSSLAGSQDFVYCSQSKLELLSPVWSIF